MAKKNDIILPIVIGGGALVGGALLLSKASEAGADLPEFISGGLTSGLETGLGPLVAPLTALPGQIGTGIQTGLTTGISAATSPIVEAASRITGSVGDIGRQAADIASIPANTIANIREQVGTTIGAVTATGEKLAGQITQVGIRGTPVAIPTAILGAPFGPVGIAAGAAAGTLAGNIVFQAGAQVGEATRTLFPGVIDAVNQFTGGGLKALSDFSRAIFGG